jgi:hypothetical protein
MKTKLIVLIILTLTVFEVSSQGNKIWSTYYGGPSNEVNPAGGPFVATDLSGNVFLTGYTYSSSGISSGGFQNNFGGAVDGYLVKFNSSGNRLWATYFGGSNAEYVYGLVTDASGNVYVSGKTASTSSVSSAGHQNAFGGGTFDAFLIKFDTNGNRIWATYYGGSGDDSGNGISVDVNENVYLTGITESSSNISSGGFQNSLSGTKDAFLAKFNSSGARIWATYYGGTGYESGNSLAIDTYSNVYMSGSTTSTANVSIGGFQNVIGGSQDAFLVKFDSNGNRIWASYYGGLNIDIANCILCSPTGNIYIAGYTLSTNAISFNGFQNTFAGGVNQGDAFLVKFDPLGNRIWASYYGGTNDDYCLSMASDNYGNVYIGGDTYSNSGIAVNGFQNVLQGTENEFIAKIDSSGNIQCATYFGVNHDEDGHIAVDQSGFIYLAGGTQSTMGIASGGFQNSFGGGGTDSNLAKFSTNCLNVSVDEVTSQKVFSIFPNPISNSLNIKIEKEINNGELIIINAIGQTIYTQSVFKGFNEIYLENLNKGLYTYLLIQNKTRIAAGKIIVE